MNFLNPLLPLQQAYKTAHDSFTIAKRAIKTSEPTARQRLLQRTDLETLTILEAERVIIDSHNEVDTLFVLALWAAFERFLRDYLQYKGQALQQHLTPADFAQELYFHKEVEFWRPEEISTEAEIRWYFPSPPAPLPEGEGRKKIRENLCFSTY